MGAIYLPLTLQILKTTMSQYVLSQTSPHLYSKVYPLNFLEFLILKPPITLWADTKF